MGDKPAIDRERILKYLARKARPDPEGRQLFARISQAIALYQADAKVVAEVHVTGRAFILLHGAWAIVGTKEDGQPVLMGGYPMRVKPYSYFDDNGMPAAEFTIVIGEGKRE